MSYIVETLQTVAECEALLTKATNEKAVLTAAKVNLELERTRLQNNATEADTKIPSVQVRVNGFTSVIPTMPEGPDKKKEEFLWRQAENKLFVLNNQKANYSPSVKLEGDNELAILELQIGEKDAFIVALTARRDHLQ